MNTLLKNGRHDFIESDPQFGKFQRVIYCKRCGLVVWDWNANEHTTPSIMDYQAKVGTPCLENGSKAV